MTNVIPFRPLPRAAQPHAQRYREMIEGAVAHALDAVDELIAVLDGMDAATEDLEPDPDEDGGDSEPSLGAPEGHSYQVGWGRGSDRDLEQY